MFKRVFAFLLSLLFCIQPALALTVISRVNPDPIVLGQTFTIEGKDFGSSFGSVRIGDVPISLQKWTPTTITAIAPSTSPRNSAFNLSVTTSTGSGASLWINTNFGSAVTAINTNLNQNLNSNSNANTNRNTNSNTNSTQTNQTLITNSLNFFELSPGKEIYISGQNLSNTSNMRLCFSKDICYPFTPFQSSSTTLRIETPDKEQIPSSGTIYIYLTNSNSWLTGPSYTYERMFPRVTKSTQTVIPRETKIVIEGEALGINPFRNQICHSLQSESETCMNANQKEQAKVQWSENKVEFILPFMPNKESGSFTLKIWRYKAISGQDIFATLVTPQVQFLIPDEPAVSSMTPGIVTPGQTDIHIYGKGFGKGNKRENMICFNQRCLSDYMWENAVRSWSPNEIVFQVPEYINNEEDIKLDVYVYSPKEDRVRSLILPYTPRIQHLPILDRYFPLMENGKTYTFPGRYFGSQKGNVRIGGVEVEVIEWSDDEVTIEMPDIDVRNAELKIISSNGIESNPIDVQVKYTKRYSKDTFSSDQWYFGPLEVEEAWKITEGSPEIVVAVIDSGIDTSHEDLQDILWKNSREIEGNGIDDDKNGYIDDIHGWNMVNKTPDITAVSNHGTVISSIIAANKNNKKGIAGIAPSIKIMPIIVTKVSDKKDMPDYMEYRTIFNAIKYAVDNGAKVINLSFNTETSTDFYGSIMQYAYDNNVLLVASAGNINKDINITNSSPVCDDGAKNRVIGVASLDKALHRATYSNYGKRCVDISAPGVDILAADITSNNTSPYIRTEGTSFSAPIVSAGAALLYSIHPDWNVEEVKAAILDSSKALDDNNDQHVGRGMLNLKTLLTIQRPIVQYTGKKGGKIMSEQKDAIIEVKDINATRLEKDNSTVDTVQLNRDTPPTADISLTQVTATTMTTSTAALPKTEVSPQEKIFSDVAPIYKNATAISYLKGKNIIKGYSDGTFRPESTVNRAEFLKLLFETQSIKVPTTLKYCFDDVNEEWFAHYVCFAKAKGIIQGYTLSDGKSIFNPNKPVNKAEALKMTMKAWSITPDSTVSTSFPDIKKDDWFTSYIATAERMNLLEEKKKSYFGAGEGMKRGTVSEILYRLSTIREKGLKQFQ